MSLVLGCGAVRDEENVSSTRPCVAPEVSIQLKVDQAMPMVCSDDEQHRK